MSEDRLVDELRRWGNFKVGDIPPAPDNAWGPPLSKLLNEAADLIEKLRAELSNLALLSGAVSIGQSYADIAKDARHDVPVGETANNG